MQRRTPQSSQTGVKRTPSSPSCRRRSIEAGAAEGPLRAGRVLGWQRAQVEKIARSTGELIGLGRALRDDEITVLGGWAGDTYGIPVPSALDAMRLTGSLEGVILDPVYEGKSMAALIDLVRDGEIPATSNVLYAHLGGQPAVNAYSALFR